jgi:hypothetical protein
MSFSTVALLALVAASPIAPSAANAAPTSGRVAIQLPENCKIVSLPSDLTGRGDAVNICQPENLNGPAPIYGNNIYVPDANAIADLKDHWSQPYVEALIQQGILPAPTNGEFRPDTPLTHAELTAWLDRALKTATKAQPLKLPSESTAAQNEPATKATTKATTKPADGVQKQAEFAPETATALINQAIEAESTKLNTLPATPENAAELAELATTKLLGEAALRMLSTLDRASQDVALSVGNTLRPMTNRLSAADGKVRQMDEPIKTAGSQVSEQQARQVSNPELLRLARSTFETKKNADGTLKVAQFSKELRGKARDGSDAQPRVSRLEAVVGLVDALELAAPQESATAAKALPFRDADRVSDVASDRLRTAIAHQLVVPDSENPDLHPNLAATRSDVAVLLYRALVEDGRLAPVVITSASALSQPKFERKTDVAIDVELDTAIAENSVSNDLAMQLFATPEAPGVIAIGMAEGTRTVDGGKTSAYWGHTDPGNGKHNLGSFSYQHGAASPEHADALQLQRMYPYIAAMQTFANDHGMSLSALELVAGIDLATQAPLAAQNYLANLKEAKAQGFAGMEAIFEARSYSYINPYNGQLEASGFGNDWGRLRFDQARRIAEIRYALDHYGVQ